MKGNHFMGNSEVVDFISYNKSISVIFDALGVADLLAAQSKILLKPNLINASPFPITTASACCEAIVKYIQACSKAEIVIGEGSGAPSVETGQVFKKLGYTELADRYGLELVDLNHAPLQELHNKECFIFPTIFLPKIVFTHFLISIPVLKVHSLAGFTGSLKNLIGLAPPSYYSGSYGSWKKAVFHGDMQQSIIDLTTYRTPDLTLMDASVGLSEFHLGGATCNPPIGKLVAGYDAKEVDRISADLLGLDWQDIKHLL
jgi:uncharacterized protein (DUF362 family)